MSLVRVTTMCLLFQALRVCPPLWQAIAEWDHKQRTGGFQKAKGQETGDCVVKLGTWDWYMTLVHDILQQAEYGDNTDDIDTYLDMIEQADVNTLISSHYRQWPGLLRPDL